tara:strand:+ start:5089 stop:9270 length:4182 start_codon:yes stop_codon:yes gene_type:complete
MADKRGKFTKGSSHRPEVRGEMYYALEDLLAMGIDIRSTSLYRDRESVWDSGEKAYNTGSAHGHAGACDITHEENQALMKFFFGEQYDPSTFTDKGMKNWKLTPEAEKWAKKHNVTILDEYDYGRNHLHLEVQTIDSNSENGNTKIVSEHKNDFSSSQSNGTPLKGARYWGAPRDVFVENEYNTSEFYEKNVGNNGNESTDVATKGGPTNIINTDDLNETDSGITTAYNQSGFSGSDSEEVVAGKTYNMPENVDNPTQEMLDTAPQYNTAQEVSDAVNNGELENGDIIKLYNNYEQLYISDGKASITPYRESDNTFNGGEGGTKPLDIIIDEETKSIEKREEATQETEVIDQPIIENNVIYRNDEEVLDALAEGKITSDDIIEIDYDGTDKSKNKGDKYTGKVKFGSDENGDNEFVEYKGGEYIDKEGDVIDVSSGTIADPLQTQIEDTTDLETESTVTEKSMQDIQSDFERDGTKPTYEEYKRAFEIKNPGEEVPGKETFNQMFKEPEIIQEPIEEVVEEPIEEEVEDVVESEVISTEETPVTDPSINDSEEIIRARIEKNNIEDELNLSTEQIDERVKLELEDNEWKQEELEELKSNQKYIDKIFADNPDIAAKYEGLELEEYENVDGFMDEVYEKIYEEIDIEEESERVANKEETGVFETNEERDKREVDTFVYNDLLSKKDNGTITAEEELKMQEIEDNNGGWNPSEIYEINKTEQAEKDLNESEGRGAITNYEVEQNEINAEELEQEREENFKITGKRETEAEKYTRQTLEKDKNEEDGNGRLTNVQLEDEEVVWSTPESEKELRNNLKEKLKQKNTALETATDEEKIAIEKEIESTNLALEYLELKKEYGTENDVFDINTINEAVENGDTQQLNMLYNDQRKEAVASLELKRKSITDGTFEGTIEESDAIIAKLDKINTAEQKNELPEFDSETDKLLYMTNASVEEVNKLKLLQDDKKYIEDNGKVNTKILNLANSSEELKLSSGITTDVTVANARGADYVEVYNPTDGTISYVKRDWINSYDDNTSQIEILEKKNEDGTILPEEKVELKNLKANVFHTRDVLTTGKVRAKQKGHPKGINRNYDGGTDELDQFILNRKKKIFQTGANPDVNLTPSQLEIFERIQSEDYDNSNLNADLDLIVSETPEAFEFDETPEYTDEEIRSMGPSAQDILKGTLGVAQGVMDAFGGPDALINAVMGKKALAAAMKDVTPMEQAKLSPMFMEHLRETKELSKRGYHPAEEMKIRKGIDTAYQQGLENSIRGTAGDRAKYLAASGIFDSKRTSALLEVASQDALLQRENQKSYSELLTYKENFDATQQEAKRTENLQMQLANKKAASEFAGLTFANALSKSSGSALQDFIKNSLAKTDNGFNISSTFEDNTNLNENE